jgi:hypothetical protein
LHARFVNDFNVIIDVIFTNVINVINVINFTALSGAVLGPVGVWRLSPGTTGACAIAIATSAATTTALFGSSDCSS